MYMHIGGETLIALKDIIFIINMENLGENDSIKDFLNLAEAEKRLKGCSYEVAKSFILTSDAVYLSHISTHTLWRRGHFKTYML